MPLQPGEVFFPRGSQARRSQSSSAKCPPGIPPPPSPPWHHGEPQAPSSFGWAFYLGFKYSCAFLLLRPMGKEEKGTGFRPPPAPPVPRLGRLCVTPGEQGWDSERAGGGTKPVFLWSDSIARQGLGLTTSCAFTRVYCFMGSEDKSGVFGVTVRPFSAKAASAQTLLAVPTALLSVRKSKHLVPCF